MENKQNSEIIERDSADRGISLADFIYILRKDIFAKLIIFALSLIVGLLMVVTAKDVYVSSMSLMVKAYYDNSTSGTVNVNVFMPTVDKFLSRDIVIEEARKIADRDDISASAVSTSRNEEEWIIEIKYSDETEEDAKAKLRAVVSAAQELAVSKAEDNEALYRYFPIHVELTELNNEITTTLQTSTMKTMLIAALAGVVLAVAYSFVIYLIGDRISSISRTESVTGLKNIATIELKRKPKGDETLLSMDVNKLADLLVYLHDGEIGKVYQIQSSTRGEGKSSICSNLGITLGQAQLKTLIIDCDFSRPAIYKFFNLPRHVGITDYFKDKKTFEEIVKKTKHENLDIITCGERTESHTVLFTSVKFRTLIEKARQNYDFVLLDCAPAGLVSDYIHITQHTDSTILTVGCDKVSSSQLKETVGDLQHSGANIVGTVFNFCTVLNRKYYYYAKDYRKYKMTDDFD